MTAAEVAHDGDGVGERSAGRHRPEGECGDERRSDLAEDRRIRAGKLDRVERVRADEAACFLDLRRQCIPTYDALDGRERVGSPVARRHDHLAEREQAYLGVDCSPVALQRSLFATFRTPEELSEQTLEHQHGIVGQRHLRLDRGGDQHRAPAYR
jgi:hypothetical protein